MLGDRTGRYTHTVGYSRQLSTPSLNHLLHYIIAHKKVIFFTILILVIMTIVIVYSGAMWALGLVVLLVTVAGVLALLVYVLKW